MSKTIAFSLIFFITLFSTIGLLRGCCVEKPKEPERVNTKFKNPNIVYIHDTIYYPYCGGIDPRKLKK